MHLIDLHADDFVLDPEFLAHPAILAVGPTGVVVILAALLYRHRTGEPVPHAVLERTAARPAAMRAIAACVGLGLLTPVRVGKQAAYALSGYARDAGTDGGTRRRRVLAALRARRFRARGDRAVAVPLPFGDEGADEYPRTPDRDGSAPGELSKTCGKQPNFCGKAVAVTHSVTHPVTLSRSGAARPLTSSVDLKILDLQDHRRPAPEHTPTARHADARAVNIPGPPGDRPRFGVLCAVVRAETTAHPELAGDRLELLEHVKTICARAHLAYRGADVSRAIEAVAVAATRARA